MKAITKTLAGAAVAAAMTVTAASPAQAQIFGRDRYDRGGIDAGDIITGVAVMGGIAAILGAFNRDGDRYGYDNRYRYRNDYQAAVNACGYEAERYARGGQVSVTDVDRRSGDSYRVRGVIDAAYGSYGNGRYDNRDGVYGNGRYDNRDGVYGNGRYGNRYGYGSYDQRVEFSCTARADGRIRDFDIDRV